MTVAKPGTCQEVAKHRKFSFNYTQGKNWWGVVGVGPPLETDNPHCKCQGKKLGGSGFDPLGPDSSECIHYDMVSFSLFILQCLHNLFCTIFMFIFIVSVPVVK